MTSSSPQALGSSALAALLSALVLVSLGCASPGAGQTNAPSGDQEKFDCSSRRAEYMVVGGFVAKEAGMSLTCDNNTPILTAWKQTESGQRQEKVHTMTAGQFESTWTQIDSTGWRYLEETCPNSDTTPGEPVYVMNVGDHALSVNLSCGGKELPFPYDRLVNELELRAAGFQ